MGYKYLLYIIFKSKFTDATFKRIADKNLTPDIILTDVTYSYRSAVQDENNQ